MITLAEKAIPLKIKKRTHTVVKFDPSKMRPRPVSPVIIKLGMNNFPRILDLNSSEKEAVKKTKPIIICNVSIRLIIESVYRNLYHKSKSYKTTSIVSKLLLG